MAIKPLKIFLFVLGGTVAATAAAFMSGGMGTQDLASPSTTGLNLTTPSGEPAAKGGRLQGEQPASGGTSVVARIGEGASQAGPQAGKSTQPVGGSAAGQADTATGAAPATEQRAALAPSTTPSETQAASPANGHSATLSEGNNSPSSGAPSFDVLRVEGDGSTVVAGQAEPGSAVTLQLGAAVLGSATAGAGGDFVIVLDQPLKPGDHQLSLSAAGKNGEVKASTQTAVVSVPDQPSGQVLAMVEEPGQASRLLTVPEAAGNSASGETAGQQSSASAAGSVETGDVPAQSPSVREQSAATSSQTEVSEGGQHEANGGEPDANLQPSAPASSAKGEAAQVDAGSAKAGSQDGEIASLEKTGNPALSSSVLPRSNGEVSSSAVAVQAVEIEGSKIFVAGSAAPGSSIRVYAGANLLGDTVTSATGQFLVEANRDLPVGSYVVRADVIGANGEVTARAAVPFEREPGQAIAAVAPGLTGTSTPSAVAETQEVPVSQPEQSAVAGQPTGVAKASPSEDDNALVADRAQNQAPAAAGLAADAGGRQAPSTTSPAGEPAAAVNSAQTSPVDVAAEDNGTVVSSQQGVTQADPNAPTLATQDLSGGTSTAGAPAAPDVPSAVGAANEQVAAAGDTALAPRLESVNGAVIIRRGDNLWRISRRVYGRGTRYSTIYLANHDQIRNPDLIMPGQIFAVPSRSQEGEAADMKAMGEQSVPAPAPTSAEN